MRVRPEQLIEQRVLTKWIISSLVCALSDDSFCSVFVIEIEVVEDHSIPANDDELVPSQAESFDGFFEAQFENTLANLVIPKQDLAIAATVFLAHQQKVQVAAAIWIDGLYALWRCFRGAKERERVD